MMHSSIKFIAAAAVAAAFALPAQAQTKVGTLDCDVSAGVGMILASQKGVQCMFTPSQGRRPEVYVGTINKYGIDIGATNGGRMIWTVFAPTTANLRGALVGNYVGATAEATVGAGVGANALVGGSDRTITLQPLSVQGQTGLNLAVGVAGLTLDAPRRAPRRR
jgi:hypothetical protein